MYAGGCECKSVRYRFTGKPLTCYACHCTDCQTASGSAFGLSMIVRSDELELVQGEASVCQLDYNGIEVRRHLCGRCGTTLWVAADAYPGLAALRPGTFDDTSWFKPVAHLWMRSAQPWVVLDEAAISYQKQPELDELVALWARASSPE